MTSSSVNATLAGVAAIIMWALLAILTDMAGAMPPFQLAAMSFAIATACGFVWLGFRLPAMPETPAERRRYWRVVAAGGLGLFAYHALYFIALDTAPAVEASLIAYLWPLLIVLGSAMLPGQRLRWHHLVGACAGFAGAGLIITGGTLTAFAGGLQTGHVIAFTAAFVWAGYSLAARRFADIPSSAVVWYCAASSILGTLAHLLTEETVLPTTLSAWLAVAGLGLLPVGIAFFIWDFAMKRGNLQFLGAASYGAPLLSTLVLIAAGRAQATTAILVAMALITAGAALAGRRDRTVQTQGAAAQP